MNLSILFPPDAVAWLTRYGLFCVVLFFAALLFVLLMRPFWLWYTGKSEVLERLRRLDEQARKSLFELEMLNHTLSIPLKKNAQKTKGEKVEEPLIVSESTKADFLKALEKSRERIKEAEEE